MLHITGLSVAYPDGIKAVDGLHLHIRPGERVALAGANGAGKTTLMLAVAGVVPAAAGIIEVDGISLTKKTLGEVRARVGIVFQNPDDQLFMPGIYDDVAFGPRSMGLMENEVRARVESALEQLGIAHLIDRSPLRLSGGEKRMAGLAGVLAMEPRLLLFDEPTAFLDPKARRTLIRLMNDMPQTKLVAGHDIPFLLETCERAVLIRHGAVFADGPADEVLRDEQLMRACDLEAE